MDVSSIVLSIELICSLHISSGAKFYIFCQFIFAVIDFVHFHKSSQLYLITYIIYIDVC